MIEFIKTLTFADICTESFITQVFKDKSTILFYMNTLTFEKIIQETRANKNFPQKYLQDLYNYNMEFNLPVKSSGPLTSIKCFYPLPTRLLLTEAYTGNNKILLCYKQPMKTEHFLKENQIRRLKRLKEIYSYFRHIIRMDD